MRTSPTKSVVAVKRENRKNRWLMKEEKVFKRTMICMNLSYVNAKKRKVSTMKLNMISKKAQPKKNKIKT
jgi:hypothetical protein